MRKVYYVKCKPLSAPSAGNILQNIIGSTQPGAQKMQFPYELPTINIGLDAETKKIMYTTAGIFAGGMIASKLIEKFI